MGAHMQRLLSGLFVLVILAGLSRSAAADDWQDCRQSDPDRRIAVCTQIINKGGESDKNLARAYFNRGIAHKAKGDLDRAIADYTEAIRLDPKSDAAYHNRGVAQRDKGDLDRAIADYTEAIRLNPKSDAAYHNRGVAHKAKGDLDRAIADYTEAIRLDPKYAGSYSNRGIAYAARETTQPPSPTTAKSSSCRRHLPLTARGKISRANGLQG
jgi:tetratricopeptide (TPR) repeat protein